MIDIYVLDNNLKKIGIVDAYKSLIWCNRYNKPGDCELYLDATPDSISLLTIGKYLARTDDSMICQIRRIEIQTDAETGNYLIVTGIDVKEFLNRRIIWGMANCNGKVESFIRNLVTAASIAPSISDRKFKLQNGNQMLYLANSAGFTEAVSEQVSYKNLGEKIREYCTTYQWGYRIYLDEQKLYFQLYKGADKSNLVVFSDQFENLSSTDYADDQTDMINIALVAGSGEDADRLTQTYGSASGINRYEMFIDARDIAQVITWEELTDMYPTVEYGGNGSIASSGGNFVYKVSSIDIQIVDAAQKQWLQDNYTGTVVTVDNQEYYRISNVIIADLPSETPDDSDNCTLRDLVYNVYLLNRGKDNIAEHGKVITFNGAVIPDVTFIYKEDYNLGDIVKVENQFGITANARIVEIIEVLDENGYSIEPKFEYQGV